MPSQRPGLTSSMTFPSEQEYHACDGEPYREKCAADCDDYSAGLPPCKLQITQEYPKADDDAHEGQYRVDDPRIHQGEPYHHTPDAQRAEAKKLPYGDAEVGVKSL